MSGDATAERIELLLSLRRPGEAEKLTRDRLAGDPEWGAGHSFLALCLIDARPPRAAEAVEAARRGLGLDPTSGWAHAVLGCALSAAGDGPGSEAAFREALRLNPADTFARARFGWSLLARGKVYAATVVADEGLTEFPHDPLLLELAAHLALMRYDIETARQAIEDGLRAHPQDAAFHYLSGRLSELTASRCRSHFPRFEAAVAAYAEALRLAPTVGEYAAALERAQTLLAAVQEELPWLPEFPRDDPAGGPDPDEPPPGEAAEAEDYDAAFMSPLSEGGEADDYDPPPVTKWGAWLDRNLTWLFLGGLAAAVGGAVVVMAAAKR